MVPSRAPSVGIEDSIGIFSPSSRFWGHCYLPQLWFLVLVAQSCSTLCDSMDCRQLDSSVHGILQARILERVATPFSSRSSSTQGWNPCLLHCRQILYCLSHQRSQRNTNITLKIVINSQGKGTKEEKRSQKESTETSPKQWTKWQ